MRRRTAGTPSEIRDLCVIENMNKWLSEIEIYASNSFGKDNCRQFVGETRFIVSGVYEKLERNVRSKYGKVGVILWPQSVLDKYSLPSHEYDDTGGVCVVNYSYDLQLYLVETDSVEKREIVFRIFKDAFENLPSEVGLDRDVIMKILIDVCKVQN